MAQMPKSDYKILDEFIRTVLARVESGESSASDAFADIMHPLTAWDIGNEQEFIPWMRSALQEWERK